MIETRSRSVRFLGVAAALIFACACARQEDAAPRSWTYEADEGGLRASAEHVLTPIGRTRFAGEDAYAFERRIRYRKGSDASFDTRFFRISTEGVSELGRRSGYQVSFRGRAFSGSEEIVYEPPQLVLPRKLSLGRIWRSSSVETAKSRAGVVRRSRVDQTSRIAGREIVKSPAGEFDCFVIDTTLAERSLDRPGSPRTRRIRRWYAPALGWYVKESRRGRDEPFSAPQGTGEPVFKPEIYFTIALTRAPKDAKGIGPLGVPIVSASP